MLSSHPAIVELAETAYFSGFELVDTPITDADVEYLTQDRGVVASRDAIVAAYAEAYAAVSH